MAYFQAEATWRPDQSGKRLEVEIIFFQLTQADGGAPVSVADLLGEESPRERHILGHTVVADPDPITLIHVRRAALKWLRDTAGMTGTDCFELRISTQADVEFLDRLTALTAA